MSRLRAIVLFVGLLYLGACANSGSFRAKNRMNLLKLSAGMPKQEVIRIMGVGEFKVCCPIYTVTNPHRTEAHQAGGSSWEILYYYTDKKTETYNTPAGTNAGVIQDDELMPIVLRDGRLDGWGWSYWNDVVKKYEIRVR
jgi:hypothetical protein